MHSPFHTEAPEKVREVPAVAPAKAHHGEGPRGILLTVLFFALIALLVFGCYQVFMDPAAHYPYATVDRGEAQQPVAGGETTEPSAPATDPAATTTQAMLQPVTAIAANTGATGTDVAGWDTVVATFGDHQLTNQEYIYYYWDCFFKLYESYGSSLYSMLNLTVPFDQQSLDGVQTWNDYLGQMAVYTWQQTTILCETAAAEGFTLSAEDEDYLDQSLEALNSYAQQLGYATPDEYLCTLFDPCADLESYSRYNRDLILAGNYADSIYKTFYDANYDPNAKVSYCIDIRHILIQAEDAANAESMAAAKVRAEELYAQWQENPTEENFIAMAGEHTQDPGSQSTGGLYEDVYPGQMVTNFNDWCFDENRQPGDHGIVETEYGYHIMYFVGDSETVYSDENSMVAQQLYTEKLNELFNVEEAVFNIADAVFTEKPAKPAAQ